MKTTNRVFAICLASILVLFTGYGQWVQTNGPYGGEIKCLEKIGDNIFAGTPYGGVYLSTNNGASWSAASTGLTGLSIYCLAASGTNLFAGTDGGVFLSTNNGTSWAAVNSGLASGSVQAIVSKDTILFAGVWNEGVFVSTNKGTSWASANIGLTTLRITAITVHGTSLFAGTAGYGVFLSSNDGDTWVSADSGLENTYVYAFASMDTSLFAGTFGGSGVYRWTNGDSSWVPANVGLTSTSTFDLAVSGTTLFAGMTNGGGVFLSTNNGANWSPAITGLTNHSANSLLVGGTNLFVGTRAGVFVSTNAGTNWSSASNGLSSTDIQAFAVSGTNLFAATGHGGIFLSTDDGAVWTPVNNGLEDLSTSELAASGANLFAATNSGVYRSTNTGTTWTPVGGGGSWYVLLASGANLFRGTSSGVQLSTDNGDNWTWINNGLTNTNVQVLAVKDTQLFAGTYGGGAFVSTDNGANWAPANSGLTNLYVIALAMVGTDLLAGTGGGGIFRSTDNGASWTWASMGLTSPSVSAFAVSGTNVFAGTGGGGVFLSTNSGTSWAPVNPGLTNLKVQALSISGTHLFAGTYAGGAWSANLQSLIPPLLGEYQSDANTALLFHMNESSGSAAADASAYGNNGTATGTTIADGRFGKARDFNGTSDYVSVPNSASLNPPSALTVEAWFKTPTSESQSIVSKYNHYGLASELGFEIRKNNDGRLLFLVGSGTSEISINGTKDVFDNKWHHVAGTYDGSNISLYLDGRLDSTKSATGALNQTTPDVLIGAVQWYGTIQGFPFSGLIDEVRISDIARELSEFNLHLPPTNLTATPSGNTSIDLTWQNGGGMVPLMRFRIYQNTDSANTTLRDSTTMTNYTSSGLTPGTLYYFCVSAVDSTGFEGSRGYAVGCVAGDVIAPAAPQNLVVTDSSSTTITIKWRKNVEPDFLRYRIYRDTTPNPSTKVHSTTAWAAAETSKTFTGLTNGIKYYLRVTAVDSSANESPYSNEVTAVPADRLAPSVPQSLVVTDSSSTTMTIKWRRNAASDFLRYRIYRGTVPNPTTKVDSTTGGAAADTSKTFTGLTNGTRYYLRVTAVDSTGNESAYSNEVNVAPNVPSAIDDLLSQIPTDFSLAQNYPNPFNPNTVIRYGLPVRSHVRLEIFNMLGQRVALLADEEQDAHYYEKTWQADGASGLYFYRLEATAADDANRRYVEVRKMILVK